MYYKSKGLKLVVLINVVLFCTDAPVFVGVGLAEDVGDDLIVVAVVSGLAFFFKLHLQVGFDLEIPANVAREPSGANRVSTPTPFSPPPL